MIQNIRNAHSQILPGSCRVLLCPSGFKESLQSHEAADAIESGILRVLPNASVVKAPLVDGGEGFTEGLVAATGGRIVNCTVMGPTGLPIDSHFGFLGGQQSHTAVIEMAAAAGLRLVPKGSRNPLNTTTYGVGELISAALDAGAKNILFGCGDSGTCDGGMGMIQALGARIFDDSGKEIPFEVGTSKLLNIGGIDISQLDSRLSTTNIDVACNWHNILCGPKGVARVFGPQKGASPDDVEQLETTMQRIAHRINDHVDCDVSSAPGGGASGGLGAGLMLIGAKLHPRFDIVSQFLNIDQLLPDCDLVITAEGGIDFQTPYGKVPAYVAARAQQHNVPVIALAGTIGKGAATNYEHGIDAFASILTRPMNLDTAIAEARSLLEGAAEMTMRMVMIGWKISRPRKDLDLIAPVLDNSCSSDSDEDL